MPSQEQYIIKYVC